MPALEKLGGNAVQALAEIGDPDAVPRLVELLDHRDLRGHALSALQSFGPQAASAVPRLLELLRDPEMSQVAVQTLLAIAPEQEDLFAALEERALAELASGRHLTLGTFAQQGERAAALVPGLIKRLEMDADADARVAHLQLLGAIGRAAHPAVPALLRLARSASDDQRLAIIRALGSIAAQERLAVPWLMEQVEHEQHGNEAVHALRSFGRRAESARAVLLPLLGAVEPDRRIAALQALAAIDGPEGAAGHLAPLLRDENESVRIAAAQAICSSAPSADALAQVAGLLRDKQESVRGAVARALGELGPTALPAAAALCELLDDDSQAIYERALDALARIEP